ncbi:MAG: Gfo/Idh/MocA family oxidoreductase [Pirellulales bacterium]|nr:Gfo/Idh/MocA family oxidoreductase [Pirellulales bacterium]
MNLTPEERKIGQENFHAAIGSEFTRRDFLTQGLAAGVVSGVGLGSFYYGYGRSLGDPVRVGVIGTGDEGSVLIGAHTPEYAQIVAIADIRPYNVWRAFNGDPAVPAVRPGLMKKYKWSTEDEAKKQIAVYTDYKELLARPEIEGVIIALPLHLHAQVAIEALQAGKHVLTEKLMGHSVGQCKQMGRVAAETGKLLATGHQRHYSILYDNAKDLIQRGLLGQIHHVRAQWHRGNLPGKDSWAPALPDELKKELDKLLAKLSTAKGKELDALMAQKALLEVQVLDASVNAESYGYQTKSLEGGYVCSPIEELIRWRLWNRTGGGLMAELGSHQLDAASIFVSATRKDGQKVKPLRVAAMGGRHIFPADRDCDDHVYCMYEFPAPEHESDPNKKIVVTYSSINGNGFGGYGEVVMGTDGTLILEREQEVMLYKGSSTLTNVTVKKAASSGGPTLNTTDSGGGPAAALGKKAIDAGPISRGYTEEIEHWAWCIRNPAPENLPKCHPPVALADAVIALVSNVAIAEKKPIDFDPRWFNIDDDATPEGVSPADSVKV